MWEDLTLKQKAEIMKMSVANGVTDIDDIKQFYNDSIKPEYIENISVGDVDSGPKATPINPIGPSVHRFKGGGMKNFNTWKWLIKHHKNIDIDNDNTFDYEGYYNKYTDDAWRMLDKAADVHFDDEFKTAYHPTFSTYSRYSGLAHPKFNPAGIRGGQWSNDEKTYTLSPDQYRGPVSMDDIFYYLQANTDNGVQILSKDHVPPRLENGDIWGPILPNINVVHRKDIGGHLFDKAGQKRNAKKALGPNYNLNDRNEIFRIIADHESFLDHPYADNAKGLKGWYAVGYGSNNHGAAGTDPIMRQLLGYGWKELHAGRKMTKPEAMKLMRYDLKLIDNQLHTALGDELYSRLPTNHWLTFMDMGYQNPARMKRAAKAYRTKGSDAAINAMMMSDQGYYKAAPRNNARRGMWYYGSTDPISKNSINFDDDATVSSGITGGGAAPMNMSLQGRPQSDPYLDYINSVKNGQPLAYTPVQTEKFVSPYTIVNEAVSNANNANNYFDMLLANKQPSQDYENAVKQQTQKQAIEYGLNLENNALWNNPYIMFGDNLAANGGRIL